MINDRPIENYDGASHEREQRHWCGSIGCALAPRAKVLDFTPELWEQVMMLNLTSAFFLSQAALHGMVERKRGFIVNVSSVAARFGGGLGALVYATSKGAISTMTKRVAREFAPSNIRVNAASPGHGGYKLSGGVFNSRRIG
jgi:NAD(P)-dependent dehydrogenase (short-subunit alcohol dehydrogenase family)